MAVPASIQAMTSSIGALGPGARPVAPGVGTADVGVLDVLLGGVVLGGAAEREADGSASPPTDCEQAATSTVAAIRPAIRIQSG
ncbi:hypothetical protein GCM10027535_26120 [Mycolicibacterium hippocampi]|uniref:Uncharacterized protein n=1 Tax=Mycolicibacterium hippocampi TaxID=659824 RepID=A0A7I9ZSC7_9MYCO|nr:hypothetical protein MHIP_40890 [Mycolicibacterium hippocampi]